MRSAGDIHRTDPAQLILSPSPIADGQISFIVTELDRAATEQMIGGDGPPSSSTSLMTKSTVRYRLILRRSDPRRSVIIRHDTDSSPSVAMGKNRRSSLSEEASTTVDLEIHATTANAVTTGVAIAFSYSIVTAAARARGGTVRAR